MLVSKTMRRRFESFPTCRNAILFVISGSKEIGTLGELSVIKELIKNGWEVFKDVADCSKIDLIAARNESLVRIQVKTWSSSEQGFVMVERCKITSGKRITYTKKDVDVIATHVLDRNVTLYVPIEEFGSQKALSIRFEKSKSNTEYRKAEDYFVLIAQLDRAALS